MSKKNYNHYINDVRSKINSMETSITEAHSLADDSKKTEMEKIMTDLESIKNTLNDIQ